MPGLNIIDIQGQCGDTGWREVNAKSRKAAAELLKKAEDMGAELLLTSSARCSAHLQAVKNGWCQSPVDTGDIFTFLASLLEGDDNG